jgi:uncharacterized repeat protein (TIGR01451 family)
MVYETISTNGATNVLPNLPTIPIWTLATLTQKFPSTLFFNYSSEASLADNANGLGHHIGLAYASGNLYPVWPDNSDFLGNSSSPTNDFQLYTGYSVLPTASLVISVTETPYPPTSDESIDYYVVVTNYGPFAANNVMLTNVLAATVTLDLVRPAAGGSYSVSPNGQTIVFSFGSVPANSSLTNLMVITANQSGYVTNVASIGSTTIAPIPPNTVITNTTTNGNGTNGVFAAGDIVTNIVLVNGEDLTLSMTASPSNVDIGSNVTYTLIVSNQGPAANGLVYITNILSANLTQISNVICSPQGTYSITNNTIIFSLGTLAVGQTATNYFSATTLSLGSNFQFATNTAFATSTDFDTNLVNNYATNLVTILDENLAVGLSASTNNVNIGDLITYTVNITNLGFSSTGAITLTNTLSPS